MGNIIGEGFNKVIKGQVEQRQKIFGSTNRSTDIIKYTNANSAFVKLCSSVDVSTGRATQIGTTLTESELAKNSVLFGGLALNSGKNLREGFNSVYTVGGTDEQGFRPMPGITSFDLKHKNRGSLKESTIQITAYNREQFNIIDALYMRLGFSVLIEWGHTLYPDNEGNILSISDADLLTSKFLDGDYNDKEKQLQKDIKQKRLDTFGNYDALYGKIKNFSWEYTKDGTYQITINIISVGDIIESLKMNTLSTSNSQSTEKANEQQEELDSAEDDEDYLNAAKKMNKFSALFSKAYRQLDSNTYRVTPLLPDSIKNKLFYYDEGKVKSLNDEFGTNFKRQDFTRVDDRLYVRLGAFLDYINVVGLLYNKDKPVIEIDTNINSNIIYTNPYVLSSNLDICYVSANIRLSTQDFSLFQGGTLPKFKTTIEKTEVGKLMNVYINAVYILKSIENSRDEEGDASLKSLLDEICTGINNSLGGVNQLEISIKDDGRTIRFIDQTTLPNRDKIIESINSSLDEEDKANTELTQFQLFGFKNDNSSFVYDFGIKTEITNELATMITIGAQANGVAVGTDATAFSSWNKGLKDRITPSKEDADKSNVKPLKLDGVDEKYKNAAKEYSNFVTTINKYDLYNDESGAFSDILKNFLTYLQSRSSIFLDTASPTTPFIPINLNLSLLGLSGPVIYQKFSVDSYFLPSNYGDTLEFITKGINHKIGTDNKWITDIESFSVPKNLKSLPDQSLQLFSPPVNPNNNISTTYPPRTSEADRKAAENGLVGITPGTCGTPFKTSSIPKPDSPLDEIRKNALQLSYDATFARGQYKSGLCARYTANHALNYVQALRGRPLNNGATISAEGNANQTGYWSNLISFGYSLTPVLKNQPKSVLINYINNKIDYQLGDVLVYWANDDPNDKSASQYGHTQMYIGVNQIKEKKDAGKPPRGWTTDRFTNYGSTFVYNSKPYNCWNLLLFRAPSVSNANDPKIQKSFEIYSSYANELVKVLNLKDLLDNNRPLLKAAKGFNDDEERAVNRIRALFALDGYSQEILRKPVSWNNKFPLTALIPSHRTLFIGELRRTLAGVKSRIVAQKDPFGFKSRKFYLPLRDNPSKLDSQNYLTPPYNF